MIDLAPDHLGIVERILAKYVPECEVRAYGSRVTWTAQDYSDLDLAVMGDGLIDRTAFDRLIEAFQESSLPMRVDVLDWHSIPSRFQYEIDREYVVIQKGKNTSNWQTVQLGEIVYMNSASYSHKENWASIDYLDTGSITKNQITGTKRFVAGEDRLPSRARRKVKPGNVIYSTVRPIQRHYGYLKIVPDNLLVSTAFAVIEGREEISDSGFIYWFLTQDYVVNYLQSIAENSTSAYPSIRPSDLASLSVLLPPLDEQRAIASVLEALDDKIELNRRMVETLEEMARALFKSWFVDFDPVRAKMEGRWQEGESLPGLPADLYTLFPDRLVDSELGPIPEGWLVKSLGEDFQLTMGQSPPGSSYNDKAEGLPFFQGSTDFGFRYPTLRKYCTEPKRIAKAGDTLLSVRAPVGDINMAFEKCCIGRGVAALRHKLGGSLYTYYTVANLQSIIQAFDHTGTVFGSITKTQLQGILYISLPKKVVNQFIIAVKFSDLKIKEATLQISTLVILRDTLLPKLISGELRVGELGRVDTSEGVVDEGEGDEC